MRYYNLEPILKKKAKYNIVVGERSNGKTYGALLRGLELYINSGIQTAYIRRWYDDIKGKRADAIYSALASSGAISKLTNDKYNCVKYYSQRWYLAKIDESGKYVEVDANPFSYGFALSGMEHDKSASYPLCDWIIFDEFISRMGYLTDEFVLFMNVLSTIIRNRNTAIINMLGNTVNKYCPYFKEMGIRHIVDQKQGTIDVYHYGKSGLSVAVEYCASSAVDKPSNVYFAFDNPKLSMITSGEWELGLYPHLPKECKYKPNDVCFRYTLIFDDKMVMCEIIVKNNEMYSYFHERTSALKDNDYTVGCRISPSLYHTNDYRKCTLKWHNIVKKSLDITSCGYYQDNDVGETVMNYRKFMGKYRE